MNMKFSLHIGGAALTGVLLVTAPLYAQQPIAGVPTTQLVPGFASADIGGKELRYMCKGSGTPTVLVEQGAGISVETVFSWAKPGGWAQVMSKVEKATRICVYDRAGLGHSSPLTNSRTSFDTAHDLHALLEKIGSSPPYVFAAQSLGGINARAFVKEYPGTMVGMILVDSARPDQLQRMVRVLPPPSPNETEIQQDFRAGQGPNREMQAGEWYDFKANESVVSSTDTLGSMPLIVLTRSPNWQGPSVFPKEWDKAMEPAWQEMQAELTKLSTNSKHIIAQKAGHNIQAEEPQLVIDAILNVVKQARTK
jgi:pimeloyl-ACP methyl ester carboxylesterase